MKTINPSEIKGKTYLVSKHPFIKVHKKFLSKSEINEIFDFIKVSKFDRSETTDNYDENAEISNYRTSHSLYIPEDHPISEMLTEKVCNIVDCDGLDVEKIQIVRYHQGQQFKEHHDSYLDDEGMHRDHTFFIYLNTIDNGSSTTNFPKLYKKDNGKFGGIKVMPYAGAAVHWLNLKKNRKGKKVCDQRLRHTGSLVKDTVKYGINVWIRTPYQDYNKY